MYLKDLNSCVVLTRFGVAYRLMSSGGTRSYHRRRGRWGADYAQPMWQSIASLTYRQLDQCHEAGKQLRVQSVRLTREAGSYGPPLAAPPLVLPSRFQPALIGRRDDPRSVSPVTHLPSSPVSWVFPCPRLFTRRASFAYNTKVPSGQYFLCKICSPVILSLPEQIADAAPPGPTAWPRCHINHLNWNN